MACPFLLCSWVRRRSKLGEAQLPLDVYKRQLQEYQTYISLAVLMLLLLGFLDWPIQFLTSFIYKGLGFLLSLIHI